MRQSRRTSPRFITGPLLAIALWLAVSASASPLIEARAFWEAWSRGDVAAAVARVEPAQRERVGARLRREHEQHCFRVLDASLAPIDGTHVEVSATIERTQIEEEHYAIELRAADGQWRVARFERREESFADELLLAADRDALLARHASLVTPRLAQALARRANLHTNRNRPAQALAAIAIGRDVAERIGSDAARAFILGAESVYARRNASDPAATIALAEEAEHAALRSGDVDAIAGARVRLARAVDIPDQPRAEALLLQVIEAADAIREPATLAAASTQLAWIYGGRLDVTKSFRFSVAASDYAELSGDPSARLNAALNLAGAYDATGDGDLTMFHYARAAAVARESDGLDAELFALTKLAGLAIHFEPERVEERVAAARAVLDCLGTRGSESALPLAGISAYAALRSNNPRRARRELNVALDLRHRSIADVRLDARVHVTEAEVLLAEKKPLEALLALEEARALVAAEAPDVVWAQNLSGVEARALAMLGRRDEAIAVLREGIALTERERTMVPAAQQARRAFFDRRVQMYDTLVALLADAGEGKAALEVAEQRTARTLQDVPDARRDATPSPEIERAERTIAELNRAILSAPPEGPALQAARERLAAARLRLDDLRVRDAVKAEPEPPAPAAALDLTRVARGAAIVRYVVADDRTTVLVITPRGVRSRKLAAGKREVAKRVDALLARIAARDMNYRRDARALHDLLIAPLANELAGIERVAIVPDGPLWSLPFQALLDARGTPLLARFELHYAPSVSWSLRDAAVAVKPRSILALGDPEISGAGQAMFRSLVPGSTLGQLPDAAREAREVARLYPRSRVLTGTAADESALKREIARHDIVHLATHALIDETQPLYSGLVLASRGTHDDGLLEARELQSLDLAAELFVLSACSTARGRSYRGEGVVGLAWALLSRGVPRVVVSQWSADSKATTKLMVAFHRFLVAGDTPAAALRKAQLELRKDVRYEDPLYWAAFVVLGS